MCSFDRVARFADLGTVIDCPQMTLLAREFEPPMVVGQGAIIIRSTSGFDYRLVGFPEDVGHALRALNRVRDAPYGGLAHLCLLSGPSGSALQISSNAHHAILPM